MLIEMILGTFGAGLGFVILCLATLFIFAWIFLPFFLWGTNRRLNRVIELLEKLIRIQNPKESDTEYDDVEDLRVKKKEKT